jgi:lysozyme family protein
MAQFSEAIDIVLKHEGNYTNDSCDPGGETKFGISKKSYPNLDIKNLNIKQVKEIYYKDYWLPLKCDEINIQWFADKLFDMAVLIGIGTAVRLLQQSINSECDVEIEIDGIMGPKTLSYVNSYNMEDVYHAFLYTMEVHLKSLNQPKYINGWMIRLYS